MRPRRSLPLGFLSGWVIFLFITAFDPWPTEAKAAPRAVDHEASRLAWSMGWEASGSDRHVTGAPGRVALNRVAAPEFRDDVRAGLQENGGIPPQA